MNRAARQLLPANPVARVCRTTPRLKARPRAPRRGGFTLIELLIVLAIIAMVFSMGVPAIFRGFRKEGMRKAVSDIVEVCSNARARAVLSGGITEVVFKPQDRSFAVSGAAPAAAGNGESRSREPGSSGSGLSATWSDRMTLEMLDVNFIEYKDAEEARVRFFPDGTSDELTLILHSENSEYRKIMTEATTGLTSVEVIR